MPGAGFEWADHVGQWAQTRRMRFTSDNRQMTRPAPEPLPEGTALCVTLIHGPVGWVRFAAVRRTARGASAQGSAHRR